jgi:hypothetical protein
MKSKLCSIIIFCAALFLPSLCPAQDVANLYAAGGSYSQGATPAFAGTALYAHQLSADSAPAMYAFTMIDALPNKSKPFTVNTNIGAGIGVKVATIGTIPIFVPTTAGISYSGTNAGWQFSTGGAAVFKVRSTKDGGGIYVMPTLRVLKSSVSAGSGYQPIIGVLFGWGK